MWEDMDPRYFEAVQDASETEVEHLRGVNKDQENELKALVAELRATREECARKDAQLCAALHNQESLFSELSTMRQEQERNHATATEQVTTLRTEVQNHLVAQDQTTARNQAGMVSGLEGAFQQIAVDIAVQGDAISAQIIARGEATQTSLETVQAGIEKLIYSPEAVGLTALGGQEGLLSFLASFLADLQQRTQVWGPDEKVTLLTFCELGLDFFARNFDCSSEEEEGVGKLLAAIYNAAGRKRWFVKTLPVDFKFVAECIKDRFNDFKAFFTRYHSNVDWNVEAAPPTERRPDREIRITLSMSPGLSPQQASPRSAQRIKADRSESPQQSSLRGQALSPIAEYQPRPERQVLAPVSGNQRSPLTHAQRFKNDRRSGWSPRRNVVAGRAQGPQLNF